MKRHSSDYFNSSTRRYRCCPVRLLSECLGLQHTSWLPKTVRMTTDTVRGLTCSPRHIVHIFIMHVYNSNKNMIMKTKIRKWWKSFLYFVLVYFRLQVFGQIFFPAIVQINWRIEGGYDWLFYPFRVQYTYPRWFTSDASFTKIGSKTNCQIVFVIKYLFKL